MCYEFWRWIKRIGSIADGVERQDHKTPNINSNMPHRSAQLNNNNYSNSKLSAGNTKINVNILCDTGAHPNLLNVKSKCQHNKRHIIGFPCIGPGKLIMVKTTAHVKIFSKKFTVKYSGPYHVVAFVKNCVLLCDMENNVLPDLKPIRSRTKIDSYMENFPRDKARVNEIKDLKLR